VWRIFVRECTRTALRVNREKEFIGRLIAQMQSTRFGLPSIEESVCLWNTIERMPDPGRAWLVLRYVEGLSQCEVAMLFGVGPRTVERRLKVTRARVREAMETAHA
jgi:RNA polymerase sigma factor (sigma-70 family)